MMEKAKLATAWAEAVRCFGFGRAEATVEKEDYPVKEPPKFRSAHSDLEKSEEEVSSKEGKTVSVDDFCNDLDSYCKGGELGTALRYVVLQFVSCDENCSRALKTLLNSYPRSKTVFVAPTTDVNVTTPEESANKLVELGYMKKELSEYFVKKYPLALMQKTYRLVNEEGNPLDENAAEEIRKKYKKPELMPMTLIHAIEIYSSVFTNGKRLRDYYGFNDFAVNLTLYDDRLREAATLLICPEIGTHSGDTGDSK